MYCPAIRTSHCKRLCVSAVIIRQEISSGDTTLCTNSPKSLTSLLCHISCNYFVRSTIFVKIHLANFVLIFSTNVSDIQIIKLFAPMYCFKNFYTLKPSTHIKINFDITPTCFGPIGPSSGSTSFLGMTCSLMMVQWDRNMLE